MSSYRVINWNGSDDRLFPYLGVIIQNWMTTLRDTNDWFKMIDQDIYFDTYKKAIKAILARPTCSVRLAVLDSDIDVCIGWSVCEGKSLHYCFVRREGRKQGIGRSLVPSDIDTFTHLTVPGVAIWKTKLPAVIFNPFLT